jgi:hypothetical protein
VIEALQTARVRVTSGLGGNERIVVAGMSRLIDGSAVRVVSAPAPPAASGASAMSAPTAAVDSPTWKRAP